MTGNPWEMGFDEFAGFMNYDEAKNYYADYLWRYAPNSIFDSTNNRMNTFIGKEMLYYNTGEKKGQYLPELFINASANFVKNNQPDAFNHFRPFFLLVNLPSPRTATTGADDFPVPSDAPFTGESWPQAAKNRAALITRLDTNIGRLFEQLQKSGLTNNLALFFTSVAPPEKFKDAKLNFLRPNGDLRGQTPEASQALPMIVRWPDKISAGQVSDVPWTAADFAPTALEIGYAKQATNFTGASILPKLRSQRPANSPEPKP
jgi:arylsulfatase A-like enzyme